MFFLGQILTRDLDSLAVPREADGLVRSTALLGSQLLAEASLLTPHLATWRPCPHSFLCVAVTLINHPPTPRPPQGIAWRLTNLRAPVTPLSFRQA